MRDLDGRDLITRDFLLISGDVISNIALEPILNRHRSRREADKNAIMTMVLREPGPNDRLRSKRRKPVFVIDPKTERCLHYEETGFSRGASQRISIDPIVLKEHPELEVRGDLVDCYIDICTPDVLGLWSDNFDYSNLRRSFLHGVLKDYELNGKTIYTAIVGDQYATRVKNLQAYDIVSKDVLGRRTYPLCPDSNLLPGQSYQFQKGNIYREGTTSIARTSTVKRKVVVGHQTSIRDRSLIVDSTVGRNCRIGSNVEVSGSYIWDDVQIGDGTKIKGAIIASGAVIGNHCSIGQGVLIPFGASLADGTSISGKNQATRDKQEDDGDSDASSTLESSSSRRNSEALAEPSMSEFSESDSEFEPLLDTSRRNSMRSDLSSDFTPNRDFLIEATSDILDALENGVSPDNISLELVSLRMKEDASQHQVRQAVVAAFMRRVANLMGADGQSGLRSHEAVLSPQEAVKEVFTKNEEVVRRTLFDYNIETKTDQVDFLMLVQKDAASRSKGESLLLFIAKELYDLDLVEEDGIMQWWANDRGNSGDMKRVRSLTEKFITFLETAEEESDEKSEEGSVE